MPASDLALLIEAAKEAGKLALRHALKTPIVTDKPGGAGPVTDADLAVDALLKARLMSVRPDYGWLSEETPDSAARLKPHHTFIIDTIDGTRAFIAGTDDMVIAHATQGQLNGAMSRIATDFRGVVLIPEVGHWLQQEAPDETNKAMMEFLQSL